MTQGPRFTQQQLQQLLSRGVLLQPATAAERLSELIAELCPQRTRFDLIRIGGERDGGYLVPDDLAGIRACFSPGVDRIASFEEDLQRRFGIGSHLADYSVEGPPAGFSPLSFTRKFVGAHGRGHVMTLDSWIESCTGNDPEGDLLLQMDIEGAEYETLLATSQGKLRRFRILVIEFHDGDRWAERSFFRLVRATFDRLLEDFTVVHIHPNNCCGIANLGGVDVPRVFEMTLLRHDRAGPLGPCLTFPHPHDRPNLARQPDLVLPATWYGRHGPQDPTPEAQAKA